MKDARRPRVRRVLRHALTVLVRRVDAGVNLGHTHRQVRLDLRQRDDAVVVGVRLTLERLQQCPCEHAVLETVVKIGV